MSSIEDEINEWKVKMYASSPYLYKIPASRIAAKREEIQHTSSSCLYQLDEDFSASLSTCDYGSKLTALAGIVAALYIIGRLLC